MKIDREKLRMKFGGKCAYCGVDLPEKGWHGDHVKPVIRNAKWVQASYGPEGYVRGGYTPTGEVDHPDNDTLDNIFPACAPCNIDKGASSLEEWRHWLQDRMIESMRENWPNFRHALRFGRIAVINEPLIFWFEKYEKVDE